MFVEDRANRNIIEKNTLLSTFKHPEILITLNSQLLLKLTWFMNFWAIIMYKTKKRYFRQFCSANLPLLKFIFLTSRELNLE